MKRVFGVLTFLLLPAVVCAAEPVAVPSAPFLDYFAGRDYVFEKFEGMCPLALATYTLEANRFAGTLVVTECRQKLFHNLFFTVYRDLDADKVKESLKDVRHVFMQAAGETPAMERWLNRCIGAGKAGTNTASTVTVIIVPRTKTPICLPCRRKKSMTIRRLKWRKSRNA